MNNFFILNHNAQRVVLSKKYRVKTTDSNHSFPIAENRLNRNFYSKQLGEKWVSDITYIKVGNQWNYLTTVLDLADRKICLLYTSPSPRD